MISLPNNFEGTEKKLELLTKNCKLRSWGRTYFEEAIEESGAKVLSVISNDFIDAYLLSESSMFVYDDSIIIITCGKTCILNTFEFLVEKIKRENILYFFYERKNPMFPKDQKYTFTQDAKRLNKIINGKAYIFGSIYENHICLFHNDTNLAFDKINGTFEILMQDLSHEARSNFLGEQVSHLGLDNIIEGFKTDHYLFDPPGYSLNAIKGKEYYTFHVTPNDLSSYASFETNYVFKSYEEYQSVLDRVLDIFKPNTFDIVQYQSNNIPRLKHYDNKRKIQHKISPDCSVEFFNFFKPDKHFKNPTQLSI